MKNGQTVKEIIKHGIRLVEFSTVQNQDQIQKIINNSLKSSPLKKQIDQKRTYIYNNQQTIEQAQNIKIQKLKTLHSIEQRTQIPFLIKLTSIRPQMKTPSVLKEEYMRKLNDLKEIESPEDLKLNYYLKTNQIFSKNTSQEQSTTQVQNQTSLNSITKKPISEMLFLENKNTIAYSTVEELKTYDEVLNTNNLSQTDLPNDFTPKQLLNIESNTKPYSLDTLLLTTKTTIPTEANIKENIIFNLKKHFRYSAISSSLTNTTLDVDNLTNILDFSGRFKNEKSKNMKTEQELLDTLMDFEEDILTMSPKEPSLFEEVDQNLNSISNNFNFEFLKLLNNNLTSTNDNNLTEHKMTSLTPTEYALEKDEESITYECINPQKVHAFINDSEYNITSNNSSTNVQMVEHFLNFDPINNNNNRNSNNNNNFNNIENVNFNFNNINHNSYNNYNFNVYNNNTTNIYFNSEDVCTIANNNLSNISDNSNTYIKKKANALKLKIKPNNNSNENIATPDVIEIVEALQQEKEKENFHTFANKILSEDLRSSRINHNHERDASSLHFTKVEQLDLNQMSSCDSAMSNTTSEKLLSSSKYECLLSVTCSSMNSYSDDGNISTSYLSTPPQTPSWNFSQISGEYSAVNSTQYSDNTQNKSKKKRGRPPLSHSSPPSSEQLQNSDPNKRKYLEQRYKNNEASRISRRNRKRKEEEEKLEEIHEIKRNNILKAKHVKLKKKHEFLKDYLRSVIQN